MARRRWIADQWEQGTARLLGTRAMHLARVLRATPGMRFEVVAGEQVWLGEIEQASEQEVRFRLLEKIAAEQALPLTLLLAVFKFDRLEWALEKATELGVRRVVPVVARRTEKHLAQAAAARVARWRRVAEEAARQSRRAEVPSVDDPATLSAALNAVGSGERLLLDEAEVERTLAETLSEPAGEYWLAVGPEGGWTEQERVLFHDSGWKSVTLGPRVLRAETAAMAACAVVGALLG